MKNFIHTDDCPIRDVLSRLSSKWGMLVLVTLNTNEVMCFGDISQRMQP